MHIQSHTHIHIKDVMIMIFPIHVASYSANIILFKIIPPISTYFYRHIFIF